ncbi:MAG: glucose-6-phosphate dehydrogenase [Pseudomonadota bacterium]
MAMQTIPVDPFDLTIFGATGDLATRKILPGLFRRMRAGQMPKEARIIGAARTEMTRDDFRALVKTSICTACNPENVQKSDLKRFLNQIDYLKLDVFADTDWHRLKPMLRKDVVHAFYFSVGPGLFGRIARCLKEHNLAGDDARIVVEKPFGRDLASAKQLNTDLRSYFHERQIYRIDHYLGKETVQNLMAIRFANSLFEPLWNSHHIDHVQITVAESLSVEGRGTYYDKSGAMRDMVQNHMMQLLCLTAMEPPSKFEADAVRDEKLKVIRALEPVSTDDVVRGQYLGSGAQDDYKSHAENPNTVTESYVALRADISNWRWAGVPFYLRTGKRLRDRVSEIVVVFKHAPHSIFGFGAARGGRNVLTIRLQPDEGITLRVTIKDPGPGGMRLREVPLDMSFAEALSAEVDGMPDAYERLIMDVIRGNQTLFMRGDEVEAAWAWVDPLIDVWAADTKLPQSYDAGSQGPEDALHLLARDGRRWRRIGGDS